MTPQEAASELDGKEYLREIDKAMREKLGLIAGLTVAGALRERAAVRSIASSVRLHVITTGRHRGVTFARCACGWLGGVQLTGLSAVDGSRINAHLLSTVRSSPRRPRRERAEIIDTY